MCYYDNKHRHEKSFEIGDQVYLKLQSFRQNSVDLRKKLKLSLKYYGPFTVIEKVGQVAYEMDLRQDATIHNVFHVSLLKKKKSAVSISLPTLPITDGK